MSNNETPAIELDNAPLHPIPLVASALMRVRLCQTVTELQTAAQSLVEEISILAPMDRTVVANAVEAKRALLTQGSIVVEDRSVPVTGQTIGDIVANANEQTASAQGRARRAARAVNVPTPEVMRAAIVATRATVSDLLKDGLALAVDPTKGNFGVVIAFGKRKGEVDPVTMRDRQALIVWADLIAALKANGLDEKLLGKAPSDHRHFSDAVGIVNNSGYVARAVKTLTDCDAQWIIGSVDIDAASTSLGVKDLVVTLHTDGRIETSNESPIAVTIKRDFYRRTGDERITATLLRDRIERALTVACQARDCDLGIYVAPAYAAKARTLITALRPLAGRNLYMITPASAEEISDGLALGFEGEVSKLESDVASNKIGTGARPLQSGNTLIERIETAKQSAQGLRYVLGEDFTESLLARLAACDAAVVAGLDARTANLELV